jgi:glycosyltransferase involved in cell wall biosynthesis
MIAIVVPAHDEERHLGACLRSLRRAARCPRLEGEDVLVVVALDCCTDGSHAVAVRWGALAAGARWLAFTDADSRVAPDWLSQQLAQRSDAVCGTVQVQDWREHPPAVRAAFEAGYRDADGHGHIHGANLGVSAHAYSGAGGFAPLACHEDVALVRALQAWGARIAWSAAPRVTTSARRSYRACEGFGATLERLALPSLHAMGAAA